MASVPMLANPRFTKRYVWNDTVHEVVLQESKSGQFPVADIKGSGTASHWPDDF